MRKILLFLMLAAAMVVRPPEAWADPQRDLDEAVARMQQGIPVLLRTLEVLQREAPQLLKVMQKAAEEAERNGGMQAPKTNGELPSADQMAQKLRGLQTMINVLNQAVPILKRVQTQLQSLPGPAAWPPDSSKKTLGPQPEKSDPDLGY